MSKKSRRSRAKHRTGDRVVKKAPSGRVQTTKPTSEPKVQVSLTEPVSSVPATRYQYVLPELRRIGIIAGALFLILIILTFILS